MSNVCWEYYMYMYVKTVHVYVWPGDVGIVYSELMTDMYMYILLNT